MVAVGPEKMAMVGLVIDGGRSRSREIGPRGAPRRGRLPGVERLIEEDFADETRQRAQSDDGRACQSRTSLAGSGAVVRVRKLGRRRATRFGAGARVRGYSLALRRLAARRRPRESRLLCRPALEEGCSGYAVHIVIHGATPISDQRPKPVSLLDRRCHTCPRPRPPSDCMGHDGTLPARRCCLPSQRRCRALIQEGHNRATTSLIRDTG